MWVDIGFSKRKERLDISELLHYSRFMITNLIKGLEILNDFDNTSIVEAENNEVFVEVWNEKLSHGDKVALRELGWDFVKDGVKYIL